MPNFSRESSTVSNVATVGVWEDEMGASSDQLFFVTSYTDFDRLAHGPRGTRASHPLYVYRFHPSDGSLVLLNIHGDTDQVVNPAFSRYHPTLSVVYTCTEDIEKNGKIFAYSVGPSGELEQLGEPVDAGGTSTCYLTIDKARKHLLCVNYWDSTLGVIPISTQTGEFTGPIRHLYDPKAGKKVVAAGRCRGGANHSHNDDTTIRMRQADPHSHALVLDPYVGTVAYVPDLGKDLVREFFYDRTAGKIELELNVLPSGLCTGKPDGPRYLEFHPKYNVAYVVNELSSTVAVFEVDRALLQEMAAASTRGEDMTKFKGQSTLRLIQSIKTIPNAFPTTMNTCGRICVHRSGRFVVVSNRGHQSIAIFRVLTKGGQRGQLCAVGYFHTRGETPRHFQFDASGQYLLVANQDSDSIAVFNFNYSSGEVKYTGNEYRVPSPNFVCCCHNYGQDEDVIEASAGGSVTVSNLSIMQKDEAAHQQQQQSDQSHQVDSVDSGSDGDLSCTVPTIVNTAKDDNLEQELILARLEITDLKKKLATLTVSE